MDYLNKLSPGKNVNLLIYTGPYRGKYDSSVSKVDGRKINVNAPVINEKTVDFPEGLKVAIVFWDEICAYVVETKIIGRDNLVSPAYTLELPDNFARIQRREFVRVEGVFTVFYRIAFQGKVQVEWQKGYTMDLSGGGTKFISNNSYEIGTLLNIHLMLANVEIYTLARVCRTEPSERRGRSLVAVEFVALVERDRDNIIRCVFDLQRTMRKKGLI